MIQDLLSNTTYLKQPKIRIKNFSPIEKAEASAHSQEVFENHFRDGILTKEEMLIYLEEIGIWSTSLEELYERELESLNSLKVQYYENFFFPSKKEEIYTFIRLKESKLNKLLASKLYLSEYTCEAAMDEAYWLFLLDPYGDSLSLHKSMLLTRIPEEKIRSCYFDQKWRAIWHISKDPRSIFGLDINWLNDNQLSLLYWSKMYDNIQESADPPNSKIMVDPMAVDGWMIKFSKSKDKPKDVGLNAQEVFLAAKNQKEVKEIINMNSPHGKRVLKSRSTDLITRGDLNEADFAVTRQEIQMEINKLSTGK